MTTLRSLTAVSYTHLDVYKRQVLVYGIFDNLFEPLEKSTCTLAERVLLQIVHEFDHHLLGHLIRPDIGCFLLHKYAYLCIQY